MPGLRPRLRDLLGLFATVISRYVVMSFYVVRSLVPGTRAASHPVIDAPAGEKLSERIRLTVPRCSVLLCPVKGAPNAFSTLSAYR